MKRCPECRRDYYDDSLLYCLDDGSSLLEGPGSAEEPATAILSEPPALAGGRLSESATRPQIHTTETPTEKRGFFANRAAKPLVVTGLTILILVGGFFGYRYFGPADSKQIESIAVMPFVNESGNAEVEYLSDGMTETLISTLSRIPQLSVTARSSAFRYKGKETDARRIGSELSVKAILTGRFVLRASDLSLYVELVDTTSDKVIWSETYNRPMTNLVGLQRDIARDVSTKLRTKLTGADEQKLAKNYTENAEAYQLYLRGRFHWNKRTETDILKAIEHFNQAVALDSSYALAFAGLADAYSVLPGYSKTTARQAMPKAREFARRALKLDNDLAEAHAALGAVLGNYDYDLAGAEREFKLAIELNPAYATARQWHSEVLSYSGKHAEAIAEIRRAVELEPYSLIINRLYGENLYRARRFDESLEQLKKTIELDTNFAPAYRSLSSTYQAKGDYANSVEALARYFELLGNYRCASLARESFAKGGWQNFQRTMIEESERINLPVHIVAGFFGDLGDKDRALRELEQAYNDGEYYVLLLKVDPRLDPLRSDRRFDELLKKIGFPE